MTTQDLGGGWTLHDTDEALNPTPTLRWKASGGRKLDGVHALCVSDRLWIHYYYVHESQYVSDEEDSVPLDALVELLRAAGWTCERGQGR